MKFTEFFKEVLHHLEKSPVAAFRMRKGQKFIQAQSIGIVSSSLSPSRPISHYDFLQCPRHLAVFFVMRIYIGLRETMSSQKISVIFFPRDFACNRDEKVQLTMIIHIVINFTSVIFNPLAVAR